MFCILLNSRVTYIIIILTFSQTQNLINPKRSCVSMKWSMLNLLVSFDHIYQTMCNMHYLLVLSWFHQYHNDHHPHHSDLQHHHVMGLILFHVCMIHDDEGKKIGMFFPVLFHINKSSHLFNFVHLRIAMWWYVNLWVLFFRA